MKARVVLYTHPPRPRACEEMGVAHMHVSLLMSSMGMWL